MSADNSWKRRAACAGQAPEDGTREQHPFFLDKGGVQTSGPAKECCAMCLVQAECLEYALTTGQKHGIWGGMTQRELRRLRVQRAHDQAVLEGRHLRVLYVSARPAG